jgi:CBS domain-containing protein
MRTGRQRGRWLRFILGPGKSASDFVHEHGRKISEVMTASPITITEDTALAEIVYLMERDNVKPAGGSRRQGRRHRVARQSVAGRGQPRPRGAGSDRRR